MEDAAEKLDELTRAEKECTLCDELAARRLRALSGAGHPHAHVMFVSLHPTPPEEEGGKAAGASVADELADYIPSLLDGGREKAFFTTVIKCVPRDDTGLRAPRQAELENCYRFLSTEISITTPHYIVPVGDGAARFVLEKLFGSGKRSAPGPLDLRVYDSPSFKVVPIAAPGEIRTSDDKTRDAYVKQLHALASLMGL